MQRVTTACCQATPISSAADREDGVPRRNARRGRESGGGSAVRMHTCLRRFAALQSCRHYICSICLDGRTNSQPLGMHERLAVIVQVGSRTANCTPGYAGLRAELDRVTCDAKEVKVCGLSQLERSDSRGFTFPKK